MKFTDHFDDYVCVGDSISIEKGSFTAVATIAYDECYRIDDDDSHNPDQSVTGCNEEQQVRLLEARDAWFNDEWFYGIVTVKVYFNGHEMGSDSLCGIEVNYPKSENNPNPNHYLQEVANEMLPQAMGEAWDALDDLVDTYHKECTF